MTKKFRDLVARKFTFFRASAARLGTLSAPCFRSGIADCRTFTSASPTVACCKLRDLHPRIDLLHIEREIPRVFKTRNASTPFADPRLPADRAASRPRASSPGAASLLGGTTRKSSALAWLALTRKMSGGSDQIAFRRFIPGPLYEVDRKISACNFVRPFKVHLDDASRVVVSNAVRICSPSHRTPQISDSTSNEPAGVAARKQSARETSGNKRTKKVNLRHRPRHCVGSGANGTSAPAEKK